MEGRELVVEIWGCVVIIKVNDLFQAYKMTSPSSISKLWHMIKCINSSSTAELKWRHDQGVECFVETDIVENVSIVLDINIYKSWLFLNRYEALLHVTVLISCLKY
jgi:hypothetical protein